MSCPNLATKEDITAINDELSKLDSRLNNITTIILDLENYIKTIDDTTKQTQSITIDTQSLVEIVRDIILTNITTILNLLGQLLSSLDFIKDIILGLIDLFKPSDNNELLDEINSKLDSIWNTLLRVFENVIYIKDYLISFNNQVSQYYETLLNAIRNIDFSEIINLILEVRTNLLNAILAIRLDLEPVLLAIANLRVEVITKIDSIVTPIVNTIINTLVPFFNNINVKLDGIKIIVDMTYDFITNINFNPIIDLSPILDAIANINLEVDLSPVINAIFELEARLNLDARFTGLFNAIATILGYLQATLNLVLDVVLGLDFKLDFNNEIVTNINNNIDGGGDGGTPSEFELDITEATITIFDECESEQPLEIALPVISGLELQIQLLFTQLLEIRQYLECELNELSFTMPYQSKRVYPKDIYLSIDWYVPDTKKRYPDRQVLEPNLELNWDQIWEFMISDEFPTWNSGNLHCFVPIASYDTPIVSGYFKTEQDAIAILGYLRSLSTLPVVSDSNWLRVNKGANKREISNNKSKPWKLTCYSISSDTIIFQYIRTKGKVI